MSWSLEELKVLINTLKLEKKNPLKLEAKAIQFLLELYRRDLGTQDIDLYRRKYNANSILLGALGRK